MTLGAKTYDTNGIMVALGGSRSGSAQMLEDVVDAIAGTAATGTITCTTKANYADTDYMTIGDGIQAAKVYEFDTAGDGGTAGRVVVNISGATTASEVAVLLQAAIAANQPVFTVAEASGVLTLTHKIPNALGNVTITENVANAAHTVTGMSGGVTPG